MGPAPTPEGGAGTEHGGEDDGEQAGPERGDAEAGRQVFADSCSGCHGALGTGGNGGPDISDNQNRTKVIAQVTNGGNGMPAFKGQLDQQEIEDVAAFVTKEIAKK